MAQFDKVQFDKEQYDQPGKFALAEKEKLVIIKVFKPDGEFIGPLENVVSDVRFEENINGGQGELIIRTNKKIDDYDEGGLVKYNNIIKVHLTDKYNIDKLIYTGSISAYDPYIDEEMEGTEITVLPLVSKLQDDYFRVGSNLERTVSTKDVSQVIKDIIDNYRSLVTYPLIEADVTDCGEEIGYTFNRKKHLEGIHIAQKFLPYGWYWFCREDGKLIARGYGNKTHKFVIGTHIKNLVTHKNIEDVVNKGFFSNSRNADDPKFIFKTKDDISSQNQYGTKSKIIIDGRVTQDETADNLLNSLVNNKKSEKARVVVEIHNYDLIAIEIGDKASIRNIDTTKQITFPDDMTIRNIDYNTESVVLYLDEDPPATDSLEIIEEKLSKEIDDIEDRILDVPNVNLSKKCRANTVIVGPGEEFTNIQDAINKTATLGGGSILLARGTHVLTEDVVLGDNMILRGEDPTETIIDAGNLYHVEALGQLNYTAGTVVVVNGSKIVTGTGTSWLANVKKGHLIIFNIAGLGTRYVISKVNTDTELELETEFQESTYDGGYIIQRFLHDIGLFGFQLINSIVDGIFGELARNILIQNVWVNESQHDGIDVSSVYDIEIANCKCEYNGFRGISIRFVDGVAILKNCRANNNSIDGIYMGRDMQAVNNICTNNTDSGIRMLGDNSSVRGNLCTLNGRYGVEISAGADDNIITNNQLAGNTLDGLIDGGTGNILKNNKT